MERTLQEKTYTPGFIYARMVRKTISLAKEVDFENLPPEEPDSLVDYVVELFGHQFTRDELYDWLASQDLLPTLSRYINEVVGAMGEVTGGKSKNG